MFALVVPGEVSEFCGFKHFFCEKRCDPFKFCGFRFSGGDLCDIDGKTVSYARLSGSNQNLEFLF